MLTRYTVDPAYLTRQCDDDPFTFKTTAELEPLDSIIGQRRAVEAIDFALNMQSPGYHLFITGPEGTGKSTIIRDILDDRAKDRETPGDLCMVNNFEDEYCPIALEMPTGSAMFFSRRMNRFIEGVKTRLSQALEATEFQDKQAGIQKRYTERQQEIFTRIEKEAREYDIGLIKTEKGFQPVPVKDDKPMTQEDFKALSPHDQDLLEARLDEVKKQMRQGLKEARGLAAEMQKALHEETTRMAGDQISEEMEIHFTDYTQMSQVRQFLENTRKDMLENIGLFMQVALPGMAQEKPAEAAGLSRFIEKRYQVNVLVDRRGEKGAPVVFEPSPTFQNLFGKIEKSAVPGSGAVTTHFTMIQAGSLLRADGGYLILEVESLLRSAAVWETLKTTLQRRKLQIQDPPDQPGMMIASLKPRSIEVNPKVILLGGYEIFRLLQGADPKFNKIFKVRADFDHEVALTPDNLFHYARFIARVCGTEKLLPFTPCGVTAVVEFGNRMTGDKRKLSLRFGKVMDLLKEADYRARKDNAQEITETYVHQALEQHRFRHNLYEEKVQERYDDHSILMDVTGEKIGQVNALAVYQIGEIAFGRPSRITAESYMGKPGIVNVDHEAQLSGQTHTKGVMIVSGYLGRMFAQRYPLSVCVSITFEQNYGGIDGDSASSTELYAVLSSLSKIPIRQGIAVTGSVNQKGEIQAIGGVNEKIEGFFDVCRRDGLIGEQGVMIPASNVKNLMLKKEVVQAIEKGRFAIYSVSDITQGIEVLTGVPAGSPDGNGNYPEKTVFGAVQRTLKDFHDRSVKSCK